MPKRYSNLPDFARWEREFLQNVQDHPVAREAWGNIKRVTKLSGSAAQLLYAFACRNDVLHQNLRQTVRLASLTKATARAAAVAEKKKTAPNADLFRQNYIDAARRLALEPWPSPNPSLPALTFAEVIRLNPALGIMPIDRFPSYFKWAAEKTRRESGKPFLGGLKDYAEKNGVTLSWGQIAVLAMCAVADPEQINDRSYNYKSMKRSLLRWADKTDVAWSRPQFIAFFEVQEARRHITTLK